MKYDENYKTNRNNKVDPLQCDEFPFTSTSEGAASGGDFSVCGIAAGLFPLGPEVWMLQLWPTSAD